MCITWSSDSDFDSNSPMEHITWSSESGLDSEASSKNITESELDSEPPLESITESEPVSEAPSEYITEHEYDTPPSSTSPSPVPDNTTENGYPSSTTALAPLWYDDDGYEADNEN